MSTLRRSLRTLLAGLLLAACGNPSEPERRSIIGEWRAMGPGLTQVQMTLTETARAVAGAGSWVEVAEAHAFRVTGAHAERSVSLLLDFDGMPDVNFRGRFSDEDTMDGSLNGGAIRGLEIQFVRVRDAQDEE